MTAQEESTIEVKANGKGGPLYPDYLRELPCQGMDYMGKRK